MRQETDIPAKVPTNPIKIKATLKDGHCCTLSRYDGSLTIAAGCRESIARWAGGVCRNFLIVSSVI
jgi:hypothetical protein